MGYCIGMPCLKLNNVGRTSAKCGDFKSVAQEALSERKGRDKDIDQSKKTDNLYKGFQSAAELMEYSQKHIDELSKKQQEAGKRKIRNDAVVMVATVIKPPAVFMNSLSRDDQIRFLTDCDNCLNDCIGGSGNSKSTVIHFDEQGAHLHKFWEPMTKDGRLCAKDVVNLKFYSRLNKEMPAFLRSRGWDMIDDCKAYDAAAEALKTEQEKAEERKNKGLTSVQYKAQAEAEKNRLCEEIDELRVEHKEAAQNVTEALQAVHEAKVELGELQEGIKAAITTTCDLREIEEDLAPIRKTMGGNLVYRPEDIDRLKKAAATSHAVKYELYEAEIKMSEQEERIYWLEEELKLERAKRRILEEKNEEINTMLDLCKAFLHHLNIFGRFVEWCEKQKNLQKIEKKLDNVRQNLDLLDYDYL